MRLIAITDMYRVMQIMSEINRKSRGWATVKWLQYLVRMAAGDRQTSAQSSVAGPQVSLFVMSVPVSQRKAVGIKVIQFVFIFTEDIQLCCELKTNR